MHTRRHLLCGAAALAAGVALRANRGLAKCKVTNPDCESSNCLVAGVTISTVAGPKPVEELAAGDIIITAHGPQPLAKLHRLRVSKADLVMIHAGCFGIGQPAADITLTAAHGLSIEGLALVDAGKLHCPGIERVQLPAGETVELFHLEFAGLHMAIRANGLWLESLQVTATPYLPRQAGGHWHELKSRVRSAASSIIDLRSPTDVARDTAEAMAHAA